jgi:hypothetical protein
MRLGIPQYQALVDGQWKAAITNPLLETISGIRPPVMTASE